MIQYINLLLKEKNVKKNEDLTKALTISSTVSWPKHLSSISILNKLLKRERDRGGEGEEEEEEDYLLRILSKGRKFHYILEVISTHIYLPKRCFKEIMPMRLTELDTIYRIFFICFHSILDFLTVVNIYIYIRLIPHLKFKIMPQFMKPKFPNSKKPQNRRNKLIINMLCVTLKNNKKHTYKEHFSHLDMQHH